MEPLYKIDSGIIIIIIMPVQPGTENETTIRLPVVFYKATVSVCTPRELRCCRMRTWHDELTFNIIN